MPWRTKQYKRKTGATKRQKYRRDQQARGTAHERGYSRRWNSYTARFLGKANGRRRPCIACIDTLSDSYLVDHIIPVRHDEEFKAISGGKDSVFWAMWNHQPLCSEHHVYKTYHFDEWMADNRIRLEREADLLLESREVWEVRDWLLRESGIWENGWLSMNPDPEFEFTVVH